MTELSGTERDRTIGFIGLGNMGAPMCRRLVSAGYDVVAFDVRREAVDDAISAGARAGTDPSAIAGEVDVLLTSLPHPRHVETVMRDDGALAALRPGSTWIDLTTNRPGVVVALAADAPDGVEVVDSPVTGAVDGARTGRLTLFAGGTPVGREAATPVLSHLGRVIECGALGTGNVTKLVTNQLWFVHSAAIGEAFAVGLANGVELSVLYDAICGSVGDSFVARHDAPSIFAGHYDPTFSLELCLKDLGLVGELADAVSAELPVTRAAHRAFADAERRYGPDAAELHVAKRLEDDAGLSFRLDGDWTAPWEVPERP